MRKRQHTAHASQQGNVLFIILLAIVLIGALTAAIQNSNHGENTHIDNETLILHVSDVKQYASELERAVRFIIETGKSESSLRFAHPEASADYGDLVADADPSDQIFSPEGGAAQYKTPPADVNDGSPWEFYAGTDTPGTGTSAPELVAVLPNVTQAFCDKINETNGQTGTPTDTGATTASGANPGNCINIGSLGRFGGGMTFYTATLNTMDETTFTQDPNTSAARPALEACVRCSLDGQNHFYHVLLSR